VLNRPLYNGYANIVPETTVSFDGDGFGTVSSVSSDFRFEGGKEYDIMWDGVKYSCVCLEDGGIQLVGNHDGTTDEPFVLVTQGEGLQAMTLLGATGATISIYGIVLKQLDPSFIPEDMFYAPVIDLTALYGSAENPFTTGGSPVVRTYSDKISYATIEKAAKRGMATIRFHANGTRSHNGGGSDSFTNAILESCMVAHKSVGSDVISFTGYIAGYPFQFNFNGTQVAGGIISNNSVPWF
jgi:hypothetical protein